ncbi:cyclopropane-fatty-acyl-phospholipid synthase, partial [mine drainage metagenome]
KQSILDLGCGWGSFSLYAASRYPSSRIMAVSNSKTQAEWIRSEARRRGLSNIEVETADINSFDTAWRFDRIVSIEMLEHVRNYETLFGRLSDWGREKALLFVHIFCHQSAAYPFEASGATEWMAREFISGGQMPSADLLLYFQDHWKILEHWALSG